MKEFRPVTLGEHIFSKIDNNTYLQRLYSRILYNYSRQLFSFDNIPEESINIDDALSFADLLSKSCGTNLSDIHRTRAQEMVSLLHELYPQNEDIRYCLASVLSSTGHFLGMRRIKPDFENVSFLENLFMRHHMEYLKVPTDGESTFFPSQKHIYDGIYSPYFSFSAPTSMGKTFMMRVFIKEKILTNEEKNFALLIPTRALINEVKSEIIDSLTTLLEEKNYRVVTSTGALVLETEHNYIFVVTPERMLYILIDHPELHIDYLFVDEAHKISSDDKRSAFYYKVIDKIEERQGHTNLIFASPNIPNPQVYLQLASKLNQNKTDKYALASHYSPVSQVKYVVDLHERNVRIFDSYAKKYIALNDLPRGCTLNDIIKRVSLTPQGNARQNIIYCKSKYDAITFARKYAQDMTPLNDTDLRAFAEEIRGDVHKEYYLAELVEKGVAYHIGYLPANIRLQLENYYRNGRIKTLFCTSTLLEGINLPADNLFITSHKKGRRPFNEVDFKNLMGRVGRAKYNLFGNVFIVRLEKEIKNDNDDELKKFEGLLKSDIPPQKLSIETELTHNQKQFICDTLLDGNIEIQGYPSSQGADNYDLMRKTMLILLGDIENHRRSRVRKEFDDVLTPEIEAKIRKIFSYPEKQSSDDINVSYDQVRGIRKLIQEGLCYPIIKDGKKGPDYYETVDFLTKLAEAFKWHIYEKKTLGYKNHGKYTLLSWYAVLLIHWMQGYGLNFILRMSIEDYAKKQRTVRVDYVNKETYNGSQAHKNIIIGETLEAIEEVLLFRLSNYFLKFTEEYKRQHPGETLTNDWHEFIEYGTTNRLRILLQRSGFLRDSTEYIQRHAAEYVRGTADNPKLLKQVLLRSPNELVRNDTKEIQYNVPEIFIDEGDL